jgi:hypothetical protein
MHACTRAKPENKNTTKPIACYAKMTKQTHWQRPVFNCIRLAERPKTGCCLWGPLKTREQSQISRQRFAPKPLALPVKIWLLTGIIRHVGERAN